MILTFPTHALHLYIHSTLITNLLTSESVFLFLLLHQFSFQHGKLGFVNCFIGFCSRGLHRLEWLILCIGSVLGG